MNRTGIDIIVIALMIGILFFLSGYNNTEIKTLGNRVEQLEVYHEQQK